MNIVPEKVDILAMAREVGLTEATQEFIQRNDLEIQELYRARRNCKACLGLETCLNKTHPGRKLGYYIDNRTRSIMLFFSPCQYKGGSASWEDPQNLVSGVTEAGGATCPTTA